MQRFALDQSVVVQIGAARWNLRRQLENGSLQLENVDTGRLWTTKWATVHTQILDGRAKVVSGTPRESAHRGSSEQFGTVTIESLKPHHRRATLRALGYVQAMRKRSVSKGQRHKIALLIRDIARSLDDPEPPTSSTVMRWMRKYDISNSDPLALIPGNACRRRRQRIPAEVRDVVDHILSKYYFIKDGCTIRTAHDRIVRDLEAAERQLRITADEATVSLSTVRRIVQETAPFDRDRLRLGPAHARAKWRFSKPAGRYATRPLERVEMDHTPLDIWVIDNRTGLPLGRPVLTILVCAYSGYITGFHISFEGESLARIIQSIKIAVRPKSDITNGHGLLHEWPAMGLWETLVVDNAVAMHSPRMLEIACNLGMDIEYCPVRMPWFKPVVERYIGEICRQLPAPGRPQKPGRHPDPVDPKVTACVTFEDLCVGILRWVVDVHPFEENVRKRARPYDLFVEGLASCPAPEFIDDYTALAIVTGLGKTVTVSHTGLVNEWICYVGDELQTLRNQFGANFRTQMKFDPNDLGRVYVKDPRSGSWIVATARDFEYANGLTLSQHRLVRAAAKGLLTSANSEAMLRESRLALQDHWDKAIRSGKRIRRGAKEYGLLLGLSSLGQGCDKAERSTDASQSDRVLLSDAGPSVDKPVPTFATFSTDLI